MQCLAYSGEVLGEFCRTTLDRNRFSLYVDIRRLVIVCIGDFVPGGEVLLPRLLLFQLTLQAPVDRCDLLVLEVGDHLCPRKSVVQSDNLSRIDR